MLVHFRAVREIVIASVKQARARKAYVHAAVLASPGASFFPAGPKEVQLRVEESRLRRPIGMLAENGRKGVTPIDQAQGAQPAT